MSINGFTTSQDHTDELAAKVGLQPLAFAKLFGANWAVVPNRQLSGGGDADQTPWHISGHPRLLMIRVFDHGVFLAVPNGSRATAGHLEHTPAHQEFLAREEFESGRAEALVYAMRLRRKRAIRYCTFCHTPTPPELRHDEDVCSICATRWLGAID